MQDGRDEKSMIEGADVRRTRRPDMDAEPKLVLKTVGIDELKPYPNNPRDNDAAVEAAAESILQCGYCAPIVADDDMEILAGHTRLKALQRLGRDTVQVVIASGLSEEQRRKYRLLDNKTAELASWIEPLLLEELESVDLQGFDFGFVLDEVVPPVSLAGPAQAAETEPIKTCHCPKCGFEFAAPI